MDNPQIAVESVKGLWAVLGIIVTGFISWISWYIKAHHDRKITEERNRIEAKAAKADADRLEQEYRDSQVERMLTLNQKIDKMVDWQVQFAKDQNQRLKVISEGLDLSMEDDKLIFQAFRKSKLLNGDSETQSKKLEDYRKNLIKSAYLFEDGPQEAEVEALESISEQPTQEDV